MSSGAQILCENVGVPGGEALGGAADTVVIAMSGILGLLLGSFANVVVYRVPKGESIVRPPSHCPACGHVLAPWENIPVVSWCLLGGRCHACGGRISFRYTVVEMAAGAGGALVGWRVWSTEAGTRALLALQSSGGMSPHLVVVTALLVLGGLGLVLGLLVLGSLQANRDPAPLPPALAGLPLVCSAPFLAAAGLSGASPGHLAIAFGAGVAAAAASLASGARRSSSGSKSGQGSGGSRERLALLPRLVPVLACLAALGLACWAL